MAYEGLLPLTHYGEADIHLDKGSGVVYWLVVQASGDDWELILRDGSDTGGKIILRVSQASETTRVFSFNPPLPYLAGLFVDLVEDIRSFTVGYGPIGR